jgi:hypothetical protein
MSANFSQKQRAGLTAAAGYTQFRDTIQTPTFSNRMIGRVYKDSVVPKITTGDFLDGLKRCGSSVGFKTEQKIKVFDYQENQTLDSQSPETAWRWLHINKAKYFNIKLDRVTAMQICDFEEMAKGFCENAGKSLKQRLDPEILIEIAASADAANRGNTAGPEGNINLGSFANPLVVTPYNFVQKLVEAQIIFTDSSEGSYWEDGMMNVILPNIAKTVILHKDSGVSGVNALASNGNNLNTIAPNISGWDMIFSNNVPRVKLADGSYAYYIVFAHKNATAFVQQIEECEVKDSEKSFGQYYRGLWVYGNGTLIPEGVAVGFFKFDATTVN